MIFKVSYVPETSLGTDQKYYTLLCPQVESKQDAMSDVTRHLPLGNFIIALVSGISSTHKVIQLLSGSSTPVSCNTFYATLSPSILTDTCM